MGSLELGSDHLFASLFYGVVIFFYRNSVCLGSSKTQGRYYLIVILSAITMWMQLEVVYPYVINYNDMTISFHGFPGNLTEVCEELDSSFVRVEFNPRGPLPLRCYNNTLFFFDDWHPIPDLMAFPYLVYAVVDRWIRASARRA